MSKFKVDLAVAIVLLIWASLGMLHLDWQHVVLSGIGLWLLWRAREAEFLLSQRTQKHWSRSGR